MIAACYTVFNGEELLEKSMQQMADVVDFFVICYQETSNKGEKNPNLLRFLARFAGKNGVILLNFEPNLAINTKQNERNKHQLMLDVARSNAATHVILAACDHFYRKNELKMAVATSVLSGFDVTFTAMFTYYKRPTWQLFPKEEYYMPLVIKLHPETAITQTRTYPVLVDPSVKVNTCKKWWVFPIQECALHHYSMVRTDINSKFKNAAASIRWKPEQVERFLHEYDHAAVGDSISYFQGRKIVEVENYFLL